MTVTATAGPRGPVGLVIVSNTSPWTFVGRPPVHTSRLASFDTDLDVFGSAR